MGKKQLIDKFKDFISFIGWKMFLWGNDTTEEEYWEEIYQQEKHWRLNNHREL
jgi:hypothetical protein